MFNVYWQETDKIEFTISDNFTAAEFKQIVHHIESLMAMYGKVSVLFDAVGAVKYDFKIVIEDFDFYQKYKDKLGRVAIVSDGKFEKWFLNTFSKFSNTEIKHFESDKIEAARKWIFPSKLPA